MGFDGKPLKYFKTLRHLNTYRHTEVWKTAENYYFQRQITNHSNLANLQSLSLRVISACISLHRMAAYLPNLKELNLEGSILNSLRYY